MLRGIATDITTLYLWLDRVIGLVDYRLVHDTLGREYRIRSDKSRSNVLSSLIRASIEQPPRSQPTDARWKHLKDAEISYTG